MKLVKQNIERRDGSGTATLIPEDPEDMWHVYNILRADDILRASAIRRVTTQSSSGAVGTKRVHTTLTLRVTSLDFDAASCELHVAGRVCEENAVAKLGSFHTLDLELNRPFTMEKAHGWDSVAVDMLKASVNNKSRAKTWAVLVGEGFASIWYLTDHRTVWVQNVTTVISKRDTDSRRDKQVARFHTTLLDTLVRLLEIPAATTTGYEPKPLLLAGPGFDADNFLQHIKTFAPSIPHKPLLALVPSIITARAASTSATALTEVLSSPTVLAKLSDTAFARETALLDKFEESMRKDDGRAAYGPREVESCVEKGAVGRGGGTLLISNRLFRADDVTERQRWVSLVDRVRDVEGGDVRVLNEIHASGKRLEAFGGVAALLTFPVYDLDDDADDTDDDTT